MKDLIFEVSQRGWLEGYLSGQFGETVASVLMPKEVGEEIIALHDSHEGLLSALKACHVLLTSNRHVSYEKSSIILESVFTAILNAQKLTGK